MSSISVVKNILVFSAGAICGSLGTYFGVKKYFESFANAEIEEIEAIAKEQIADLEGQIEDLKGFVEDIDEDDRKATKNKKESKERVNKKVEAIKEEVDIMPVEKVHQDTNYAKVNTEVDPPKAAPYIIEEGQFRNEAMEYDKNECEYFAQDDSLVLEDIGEREEDPFYLIGTAINKLRDHNPEYTAKGTLKQFVVYVRNDSLQADFRIVFKDQSFFDDILGMGSEGLEPDWGDESDDYDEDYDDASNDEDLTIPDQDGAKINIGV